MTLVNSLHWYIPLSIVIGNGSAEHSFRNFSVWVTKQLRKTNKHNSLYFSDKNLIKREVRWFTEGDTENFRLMLK